MGEAWDPLLPVSSGDQSDPDSWKEEGHLGSITRGHAHHVAYCDRLLWMLRCRTRCGDQVGCNWKSSQLFWPHTFEMVATIWIITYYKFSVWFSGKFCCNLSIKRCVHFVGESIRTHFENVVHCMSSSYLYKDDYYLWWATLYKNTTVNTCPDLNLNLI